MPIDEPIPFPDLEPCADARHVDDRASVRRTRQPLQPLLQELEIDRLADELGCTVRGCPLAPLVIAIGGDHHHRQLGPPLLDLAQKR